MAPYNTGSGIEGHDRGGEGNFSGAINSSLSTQVVIKIDGQAVGALQTFTVDQSRPLKRITEIGTDGVIEIVPHGPTDFTINADRIAFDSLRLPEAFSRSFRFINAQRLPFDIEVQDLGHGTDNIVGMTYKNCWFTSYSTPFQTGDYLITERAVIWCETAYVSTPENNFDPNSFATRGYGAQTDSEGIERRINTGTGRGAMSSAGLIKAVFA